MILPMFNDKTLNIFTDASISQIGDEYIGCSGAVACTGYFNNITIVDETFKINRDSTNNNSEIKAIYLGILLAKKFKNQFKTINLFSDSKISIYGLREWISNWVESSTGDHLIGSTNKPVSNQSEILSCIYEILDNDININLYHQKGHCETDAHIQQALITFKSSNNISRYVTFEYIANISQWNCYVDNKSRSILYNFLQSNSSRIEQQHKPINLVSYSYTRFNLDHYLSLVTN